MSNQFEELRTFVAVVHGKGFSAAAHQLGLAKSAVSRRVCDLETRLGTSLINRTTRQLSLTQTGAEFYERSMRVLASLKEAEELAANGSREAIGKLRMTVPLSFTAHCLAPVLQEFILRNPSLELDIVTDDRDLDVVANGFDVALRQGRLKDSSLVARRIAPIRRVACASPAYLQSHGRPEVPGDLRHHLGILQSDVSAAEYWTFRDGESVDVRCQMVISSADAIREAAIAGCGIAMLPTFVIHRAVARGELELVLRDYMPAPISLHVPYPSTRNVPTKVRHFIDFVAQAFGDRPFWDRILFEGAEDGA